MLGGLADANQLLRTVMERDLRITGTLRGQSSNHIAPKGFELSNPWKVWTTDFLEHWPRSHTDTSLQIEKRIY